MERSDAIRLSHTLVPAHATDAGQHSTHGARHGGVVRHVTRQCERRARAGHPPPPPRACGAHTNDIARASTARHHPAPPTPDEQHDNRPPTLEKPPTATHRTTQTAALQLGVSMRPNRSQLSSLWSRKLISLSRDRGVGWTRTHARTYLDEGELELRAVVRLLLEVDLALLDGPVGLLCRVLRFTRDDNNR